ncbi:hypothetical protein JW766_03140 [Candidatus Dojkabacteria bacterium]|nr:hypothetical protein [Candidatus Dojkabacteria bacterium]
MKDDNKKLIEKIFSKQDKLGRWAYDKKIKRTRPGYEHYIPAYKATLWTLITLADLKCSPNDSRAKKALKILLRDFYKPKTGIFGWSDNTYGTHEPSPCLNGNLLYLYFYFGGKTTKKILNVIKFFHKYQRFDDGNFKTPMEFPYFGKRERCYSSHTCYWGVTKLFKGLSFIPLSQRTTESQELMRKCIDFILKHEVCFSSRKKNKPLHKMIICLTFPNMYSSDFLEILWLLAREDIKDKRGQRAVKLLKSKQNTDGTWNLERLISNTIGSFGKKDKPNPFITERAREVIEYYSKPLRW